MSRVFSNNCFLLITLFTSHGLLADSKAAKVAVWERMVVLGASASAGFGSGSAVEPGLSDLTLAELIDAMVREKHEEVANASSYTFFTAPQEQSEKLIEKTRAANPTAIVALDFLFWFGYGKFASTKQRLESLEKGLKPLEEFDCPLLLGLIPDMRMAVGTMLAPEQVPASDALKALNGRILEWSRKRKSVIIVPWVEIMEKLQKNKEVIIGPNRWGKGSWEKCMQSDKLHPTAEGLGIMAAVTLETLAKSRRDLPKNAFDLKTPVAVQKIVEAKKKEKASEEK